MEKLIIALMIPGSIILCLVAGKRFWVRAVAILILLLALGIILPNLQHNESRVTLRLQSAFLEDFTHDIQKLIEAGDYATVQLRLSEFNRRFPTVGDDPGAFLDLMGDLRRITNRVPKERVLDESAANNGVVPTR